MKLLATVGGHSVGLLAAITAGIVLVTVGSVVVLRRLAHRRIGDDDPRRRYLAGKFISYALGFAAVVAILVIWTPFGSRVTFILGFASAGIGFSMQQVIGALFGSVNILSGRIFRVGDRIEMGGVQGDVIDITPLRTKILEVGRPPALADLTSNGVSKGSATWVHGWQYTGRVVTISNQTTFSDPVYNYSSTFDYIWDELTFPIPYRCDWRAADKILLEEAERISATEDARHAMEAMQLRYPVPRHEIDPRVFVRATDNWVELSVRFVLPVRGVRTVENDMTRRILDRLQAAGIEVASTTSTVTVSMPADGRATKKQG